MKSTLEAIAYLKPAVPDDDIGPCIRLSRDDSPVLLDLGAGLLVAYLIDTGPEFTYVLNRDLKQPGITAEQLHNIALRNLAEHVAKHLVIRQYGALFAVFVDGAFEASVILLDHYWAHEFRQFVTGHYLVAIPARDTLAFAAATDPSSTGGLRAVVDRVWPDGDHLLSRSLFLRNESGWQPVTDQIVGRPA